MSKQMVCWAKINAIPKFWRISRWLLAILFLVNVLTAGASETLVKYYDQGYTPSLRAYQRDLLRAILQATERDFGPYKLELFSQPMSTNRAKLVLQQGIDVNVLFALEWQGWGVDPNQVIVLELPVYKGLHGLRSLIVRTTSNRDLEQITTLKEFMALSAGQGAKWLDVRILQSNHVLTVEGQNFSNLIPMLQKSRFDYLPLSVLEAQAVMQALPPNTNDLLIHKNLMIFYPLPSFLYVPKNQPDIARRLLAGYQAISESGELDVLFERHFYQVMHELRDGKKRLVILRNPGLSDEKNGEMINALLAAYGEKLDILR